MLAEHWHVLSNDAKQTTFHTRSITEAEGTEFVKLHPWIPKACIQSDQASNYHSTEALISDVDAKGNCGLEVVCHVFTEPGEGKDEGDADCGRHRQWLKHDLASNDHEDEAEYYEALERVKVVTMRVCGVAVEDQRRWRVAG